MKKIYGNEKSKTRMRKGFTLLELIFVIVIAAILLGAVYNKYGKTKGNADAQAFSENVTTVLAGIENSNSLNGRVYIASSSKKLSDASLSLILNSLGGTDKTKDVADWTYECVSGSGSTVKLTTTEAMSPIIRDITIAHIKSNNAPWTAEAGTGNAVVAKLASVTCK